MELREFKHWLLDKGLDENELYIESIKCYQVEAYKAAYMFSYLANHKYISELAINYKGIPASFKKNIPQKNERIKKWKKEVKLLKSEDKWESTLNDLIQSDPQKTGNIFELPKGVKDRISEMRSLRNVSAHAKERKITESTVQELWNDIVYTYPYFVINGTRENWLSRFDQIVTYAGENSKDSIKELQKNLQNLSIDNQLKILEEIIKKYILELEFLEKIPKLVIHFLNEYFSKKQHNLVNDLSLTSQIFLSIVLEKFEIKGDIYDIIELLKELKKDSLFIDLCADYSNHFWRLIDYLYPQSNEKELTQLIMDYLNMAHEILKDTDFKKFSILSSSGVLLEQAKIKVETLYYYTMNRTGDKKHKTSTFDYSKFSRNAHFVRYVMYRISNEEKLKDEQDFSDFIQRCEKVLFDSEDELLLEVQEKIREYNLKYKIIEEKK
ncbi:hypothetical protein [Streptococcus pacificus]|uniref:Uncharacterized protein n=1 Tax=Streptococcus pacificus TaxID=2740577 RepID=A0ABS0ZKJ3_9STRE|nr:hypothetical protein [Streptococcus pacificus]MBJ8326546.1 hypothetical protein [Streptococcus pacificus]